MAGKTGARKGKGQQGGKIVVYGLLALLMVGLGGFGVSNFGGGIREIGSVGDVKIGVDDYALAMQQRVRQLSEQTGQPLTSEQARQYGIDQMVLQELVGRAALDHEAQRIGVSVGDAGVAQQIREIPAFQGVDGSFDRESYAFVLEQNNLTATRFEEQVRADTARGLLQGAVTGGMRIPEVYVDTLYGYAREQRDVTWAVLAPATVEAGIPAPTDADLEAYHRDHPEAFTSPEGRVIAYAWITPEMLAGETKVDEAALRQLYEDRAAEFLQPERRLVERLVFASEDEAQAAAARIAAGEVTFDALVAERGLALADIDLGDVARDELGEAAETVFALQEPGVAGPAPSNLGPALFRVNAILAPQETAFEDVRDDLAAEAEAAEARRTIEAMEGEIEDLLAGGATIEEIAEETAFDMGTMRLDAGTTEGPAAYEAFREEAMAVVEGDYPELRRLDDGGLFVLQLDELVEPALKPLAEVRDEVAIAWRAAQVRDALVARAEAAATAIAGGATFEAEGLTPGTAAGVARDAPVEGLPDDAVTAIFAMAPGEARAVPTEAGAAVVRLDAVIPADQDGAEAQTAKTAFAEQSASGLADDILAAFVRATENDAGIRLDQAAINAVHTQLP